MKTLMLLSSLAIAFSSASAAGLRGKVVGVEGGNTLDILSEGKVYRLSLRGVDCPARNESFGKDSRRFLAGMAFMADVDFEILSAASDGTFIGKAVLAGGKDLGAEMIKGGMAWWNSRTAPGDSGLARLEKEARESYSGLWAALEDGTGADWRKEVLAQRGRDGKGMAGLLTILDRN